jgi:hypothetical protein
VLVGAAIIPAAPVLVPGVSARLPDGLSRAYDEVEAVLDALPDRDATVIVAATVATGARQGLYDSGEASLAGIGRSDIVARIDVDLDLVERVSRVSQYPMFRGEALPLGLSVLGLLVGVGPVVPVTVRSEARFDALAAAGAAIAQAACQAGRRAAIVAAGDLSAGLDERSPLHRVPGAHGWDDRAVHVVDSGRLDGLRALGPDQARRVGAGGWAPMSVLHGACARAKLGVAVSHYSAPAGVGYLVAYGQ